MFSHLSPVLLTMQMDLSFDFWNVASTTDKLISNLSHKKQYQNWLWVKEHVVEPFPFLCVGLYASRMNSMKKRVTIGASIKCSTRDQNGFFHGNLALLLVTCGKIPQTACSVHYRKKQWHCSWTEMLLYGYLKNVIRDICMAIFN